MVGRGDSDYQQSMVDKKEKEGRKKRKKQQRSERGRTEEYEKKIVFWMC